MSSIKPCNLVHSERHKLPERSFRSIKTTNSNIKEHLHFSHSTNICTNENKWNHNIHYLILHQYFPSFALAIVLSVLLECLLRFMVSDYSFGTSKLFFSQLISVMRKCLILIQMDVCMACCYLCFKLSWKQLYHLIW